MQQNVNGQPNDTLKSSKGETISELAHRHLKDATHVTTDEELRNVQLDPYSEEVPDILQGNDRGEKPAEDERLLNKDDVVVSPWDAIK